MAASEIRFDDGAAYEDFMGRWSRIVGDVFLDWLAPANGLRWADIGCGNGAFTQMLVDRCAPVDVQGLDPSEGQLAFARTRLNGSPVSFELGDAMALPYADDAFDAAVMALVIFFVSDPARGVAEMARIVKPGGSVSAYAWDFEGGGSPFVVVQQEMAALGVIPLWPPRVEAARLDHLKSMWSGAGLIDVETRTITVERSFPDFDTFWTIAQTGPRMSPRLADLDAADVDRLKTRLLDRLPADAEGRITCGAFANAIKGEVPRSSVTGAMHPPSAMRS